MLAASSWTGQPTSDRTDGTYDEVGVSHILANSGVTNERGAPRSHRRCSHFLAEGEE